jgi:hypothetical protein
MSKIKRKVKRANSAYVSQILLADREVRPGPECREGRRLSGLDGIERAMGEGIKMFNQKAGGNWACA